MIVTSMCMKIVYCVFLVVAIASGYRATVLYSVSVRPAAFFLNERRTIEGDAGSGAVEVKGGGMPNALPRSVIARNEETASGIALVQVFNESLKVSLVLSVCLVGCSILGLRGVRRDELKTSGLEGFCRKLSK